MSMLGTSEIYGRKRKRLKHDTFKFPFMMGTDLSLRLFSKGSMLSCCSYLCLFFFLAPIAYDSDLDDPNV